MGTQNYSNNAYKYAGKKFLFTTFLFVLDEDGKESGNYVNNDSVVMFQYENELNKLYLDAELIITDKYAVVDKFIDRQFAFCRISHIMIEGSRDGELQEEQLSKDYKFIQNFLISSVKILDRKSTEITYQIKMVSVNWLNCNSNLSYTNYKNGPEEIFDIIKALISQVNMNVIDETFDAIRSKVKINYITNENDNLITAVNYLLNKMYYYDDKTDSLKFIMFNETAEKYQLFDVTNMELNNGTTQVTMSMFKSQAELQVNTEMIQLGSICKQTKKDLFRSIIDRKLYDYDPNKYGFMDKSIEHKTLIDYKNTKPNDIDSNYIGKFNHYTMNLPFQKSETYWNNDFQFYSECAAQMKEDGSIVVGVDPDLLRKPGSFASINLDRDDYTNSGSESVEELDDVKNKYKMFEGFWFVGKVRHLISPQKPMYRQNLVLFRNFVNKTQG